MTNPSLPTIAVLGGTGKEGQGLAFRWAGAGYPVIIGSRTAEKAREAAGQIKTRLSGQAATGAVSPSISGDDNLSAAGKASLVVITVPYAAHRATLESIREIMPGKILVDVTVPLVPPKVSRVQMPAAGSAAQEAYEILGPGVEVVDAFQNISFELLMGDEPIACDVLVTGTTKEARAEVLKLVEAAGLTGWDAGPLENSAVVEGLTSLLIHINRQYGSTHAGIKLTGLSR